MGGYLFSRAGEAPTHLVDAVLAVAFAGTGALVTTHRPGGALGPVMLFMSLAALAFLADGYASWAAVVGAPAEDGAAWLASWLWAPPMLALASVVLQLVPDGHVVSPRWRGLLVATWIFIALFTIIVALDLQTALPPAAAAVVAALGGAVVLASLASLVVRFRRAHGVERRQLTWIVCGGVATVLAVTADALLPEPAGSVVEAAGGIVLPLTLGVAVLRHDLYAMDPVLRRSLTYTLLAGALAAATLVVSTTVVALVGQDRTTYALVVTVVVVMLLVTPLERAVRSAIGRLLYGGRGDPYLVLTDLGNRLATAPDPAGTMTAVAEAARTAVAAPHVELELGDTGQTVSVGSPAPVTLRLPITFNGVPHGVLGLSPRTPAEPFDDLDRRLLADLANYAGPAVAAALRTLELSRAREALVLAREEERRRLREDLHDGVGPVLAGLAFTADAAAAQVEPHQTRLATQIDSVREQARQAVANVRRVTRGLRPESLDELGLRGALKEVASRHARATVSVDLSRAEPWPPMSAATEVAVLHVVEEAVANAVRHGGATNVTVEVSVVADLLGVRVVDDGTGLPDGLVPGVGTESMRRRSEELGGRFALRRAEVGTEVEMEVPLWQ
jgi:signal transduction histidine kinase